MKKNGIYKCRKCGLVMEVIEPCTCEERFVCCTDEMSLMEEQSADTAKEKHVPYPQSDPSGGMLVSVGRNAEHPMTKEHHIQWIEVYWNGLLLRRELPAEGKSSAVFPVKMQKGMIVREFCNIHGLWVYEIK